MTQPPPEMDYLSKFRALAAKQEQVRAAIASLRDVCDSLKNWRQTAGKIGDPNICGPAKEWDDAGLDRLRQLKMLFADYYAMRAKATDAWRELPESARVGLISPDALNVDPPTPS